MPRRHLHPVYLLLWLRKLVLSKGIGELTDRSLAAYGIDPTSAVVEQAPEDGPVEEEDMEDESDSDDDDDVKLVLTGPGNRMDLRCVQFV